MKGAGPHHGSAPGISSFEQLQPESLPDVIDGVEEFPSEELEHFLHLFSVADKLHGLAVRLAPEMSIGCGRLVDRVLEIELLYDLCRSEVENLSHFLRNEGIVQLLA